MIAVNVAQLLKLPTGTTRDFEFCDSLPELRPEIELVEPLAGKAHLLRTARGILVSATYRTRVDLACARCLEPCEVELQGELEDEFTPRVDVNTGYFLAEQPESDELGIDEHHILHLTEVMRQDLLTRIPLQPLCQSDCPGICAECGRELSEGRCDCAQVPMAASPFAGLAELLHRQAPPGASS